LKTFEFRERVPTKVDHADVQRHLSSQGHPVDIYVRSKHLTCGITTIPGGARLGRIAAHGGDEVYYIAKGQCVVETPRHGQEHHLTEGDVFLIPAGQIHAPRNDSADDLVIFWVCAPDWP
jgi:mannose-6-phosphate isomerase-like protein (cupin superfamily)